MKVQLGAFKREASELDFLFTFSSGGIRYGFPRYFKDINDAQAQWRDTPDHDL